MSSEINLKTGLAEMLKGGVIMDVVNAEQAVLKIMGRSCDGVGARAC